MVYVGKRGEETPREDDGGMRVPPRYSGNAFFADGARRTYDPDGEALRHAEELFRRGYVFDEIKESAPAVESAAEADTSATEAENEVRAPAREDYIEPPKFGEKPKTPTPATSETMSAPPEESNKSTPSAARPREQPGGILTGILQRITTEDILIGSIALILALNGSDDELLIMLVILLFC